MRLGEELADLQVEINEEKSSDRGPRWGENFGFLGFDFRRIRSRRGAWRANYTHEAQETYSAATETQGCVPPLPIAASGGGATAFALQFGFRDVPSLVRRLGERRGGIGHNAASVGGECFGYHRGRAGPVPTDQVEHCESVPIGDKKSVPVAPRPPRRPMGSARRNRGRFD